MKNIELTEDHKSKLLEMCKKLFPEYNFINFQESSLMGAWGYDFNNICLSKKSNDLYDIEINIHWFEFCMTHLANKMIELGELPNFNNKLDYEFFSILQSSWWESHPIDYLYEEFKKLK